MIEYLDVLKKLEDAGYSTYRLRKDKLLSQSTIQQIRTGKEISLSALDTICRLTNLPIEDLIRFTP